MVVWSSHAWFLLSYLLLQIHSNLKTEVTRSRRTRTRVGSQDRIDTLGPEDKESEIVGPELAAG